MRPRARPSSYARYKAVQSKWLAMGGWPAGDPSELDETRNMANTQENDVKHVSSLSADARGGTTRALLSLSSWCKLTERDLAMQTCTGRAVIRRPNDIDTVPTAGAWVRGPSARPRSGLCDPGPRFTPKYSHPHGMIHGSRGQGFWAWPRCCTTPVAEWPGAYDSFLDPGPSAS
jgi:hypothetical protein